MRDANKSQNSLSHREDKQLIFSEEVSNKKIKVNEFMMKNCHQENQQQH